MKRKRRGRTTRWFIIQPHMRGLGIDRSQSSPVAVTQTPDPARSDLNLIAIAVRRGAWIAIAPVASATP
jgi:hypothetical protein